MKLKAIKEAFPVSIPVMIGYVVMGMVFGFLLNESGYGITWTLFMSLILFAGSAQFVSISLLVAQVSPITSFFVIFLVNARHIFYGISMIDKYKGTGLKKLYLIFALTDETFSIASSYQVPEDVDKGWFYFFLSMMNQSYWVTGSIIGNLLGNMITFNSMGMDFVLTALFVVIMLDQWKKTKEHKPVIIGLAITFMALVIVGPANFLLISMIGIVGILIMIKNRIDVEDLI